MTRQYISNIITEDEINKWKENNRILITSQTGSGKSKWVKEDLYNYCFQNNKKILLLSNRIILKNQNLNEIGEDKSDVITLENYQSIENKAINTDEFSDYNIEDHFKHFDYIVFDECHYLLNDSQFNRNTDILLTYLKPTSLSKIFIFITATPEVIYTYHSLFDFTYNIPQDYSFIENLYFYFKYPTVENIVRKIPDTDKIIYFSNCINTFELSRTIPDAAFICSPNNKEFYGKVSKTTVKEIIADDIFKSRLLCSTKVLDNGVSLISRELKHVIIDMIDPIDVIQCLGRKRIIDENDRINLYIRNYHGGDIYPQIVAINNRLHYVTEINELGKEDFQKKYARKNFDNIIQNDFEVNEAKLYFNRYLKSTLEQMMNNSDKQGYIRKILKQLQLPGYKVAENHFEAITLIGLIKSYSETRLYRGEKLEEFRNLFFENLFKPKRFIDVRNRGINSINSILEEDEINYHISRYTDYERGINRGKSYWYIKKTK
jgi:hypothetical protein